MEYWGGFLLNTYFEMENQKYTVMIVKFLTRESSGGHQARKRKKGRKNISPRNRNRKKYFNSVRRNIKGPPK
jgi:hypothetical protein